MINGYDIAYALGVGAAAPYWLLRGKARRKVLGAFAQRMGEVAPRDPSQPAIMIHAVSLGEVNAARLLIDKLRTAIPGTHLVVSTTTEVGAARAQELYATTPGVSLIRYPLDFSPAIARVLDRIKPAVVVLMELEVWPNFLKTCAARGIPVVLANGRISDGSYRGYRWIAPVVAAMFRRLATICVQDEHYARRFMDLGAPMEKVRVAGTMKFDTAQLDTVVPGAAEMVAALGLTPGKQPIWVCGSTGPGEEEIILTQYRQLLNRFHNLRLVLVPRHPQRFDEVAALIESKRFPLVRRTHFKLLPPAGAIPAVILGDTMGELRKFYSIATVIFVGRSLLDLGPRQRGSDMIEAAAMAKPVIVGPWTHNFTEAVRRFKAAEGILIADDGPQLGEAVAVLLSSPDQAALIGFHAQEVVRREQGATDRHVHAIVEQFELAAKDAWPAIAK